MPVMTFKPVVLRAPEGDPAAFWVCDVCRRPAKAGVSFGPGDFTCMDCALDLMRALLEDAGTSQVIAEAVSQAAEKAAAAVMKQAAKELGPAVAGAALAAALDALGLGHAGAAGQEK